MERETFKSRLGFLLLSAGCAIGIGNVWKFPYITGLYGGGAFVVIYLIFLAIVGVLVLTMEFAIGRASRQSTVRAYHVLEKPGSKWHLHGYVALAGNFVLMMFYTTVTGWMLHYFYLYCSGQILSDGGELANALRWIGLASAAVPAISYAASGGVSTGTDIVKCLLAGASAVEICSALYKDGEKQIETMLKSVQDWMVRHQFKSIDSFRGKMQAKDLEKATVFERTQFLKYFGGKQ